MPCAFVIFNQFVLLNRRVESRPHDILDRRANLRLLEMLHAVDDRWEHGGIELQLLERIIITDQRPDDRHRILIRTRARKHETVGKPRVLNRTSGGILHRDLDEVGVLRNSAERNDIVVGDSGSGAGEVDLQKAH